MSTYYKRNTNPTNVNWNQTNNWSTVSSSSAVNAGTFPALGDTVFFDSGSIKVTVNVASACTTIDFTGYLDTITFTNSLTVSGNVTLGASMLWAGASALVINATANLTSNGNTIGVPLTLNTASTYTLADNWTLNGNLILGASGLNTVINGKNFFAQKNVTFGVAGGASTLSGTTIVNFTGSGTQGWTFNSGNATVPVVINATGTINTSFGLSAFSNGFSGSFTYTKGTWGTTAGHFTIGANTTLDVSSTTVGTYLNFAIDFGNPITLTLSSDLYTSGAVTLSSTPFVTFTGHTWYHSGATLNTAAGIQGTTNFVLTGTTTWNGGGINKSNLTINTAGTITLSSTVNYSTGTFKYITGTFNPASFVITIQANSTLDWNGGTSYVNIPFTFTTAGTTALLNSDIYSGKLQSSAGVSPTFSGAYKWYLNNGLAQSTTSVFTPTGGFLGFWLSGGSWTGAVDSTMKCNITFIGNVTVASNVCIGLNTVTYTSGTITTTGSTLLYSASATLNTAGMTWGVVTTYSTSGMTLTLNSLLSCATFNVSTSNITIAGSGGFTCGTLTISNSTTTFQVLVTYTITTAFNMGATSSVGYTIKGSDATHVKSAYLVLAYGATQSVYYSVVTDIDSSGGQTIWSYSPTLSNTLNWNPLTASSMQTSQSFVQ